MSENRENNTTALVSADTEFDPSTKMHPMVRVALRTNDISPETIRELLTVQREWEAEEARKAFTRDLCAAKAELPSVVGTDGQNEHLRTRYTTLAKLLDTVSVPLARHGFSIGGNASHDNERIMVTTTLTHRQGHKESITLPCRPGGGSKAMSNEQALGKTITYLRRYGVATILGLASGDMPDSDDPVPGMVDMVKNQRAVSRLEEIGADLREAEKKIGRSWQSWTAEDLKTLAGWLNPEPPQQGETRG